MDRIESVSQSQSPSARARTLGRPAVLGPMGSVPACRAPNPFWRKNVGQGVANPRFRPHRRSGV